MTPHDDEDNWAELADALGIDTPATQARKQAAAPAHGPEPTAAETGWAAADDLPDAHEPEQDTMLEAALAGEPAAETPADGDAEGEKKRRRRRRRRKKPGGEPAAAGETASAGEV